MVAESQLEIALDTPLEDQNSIVAALDVQPPAQAPHTTALV